MGETAFDKVSKFQIFSAAMRDSTDCQSQMEGRSNAMIGCKNPVTVGMVEGTNPFEDVYDRHLILSWKNITVSVDERKQNLLSRIQLNISETTIYSKDILKNVSGCARTGQMIAIMGPSGAGKTTLLATLAKLVEPRHGSIQLNGVELSRNIMPRIASFVPQFSPLSIMLTTSEYISFACALKLDRRANSRDRNILVLRIIDELNLTDCKDSRISEISGGERKRVSLAADIVTRPRIIFLDEPTSGLDASSAFRVIQLIKNAARDSIVLCSIHQPGVSIYNLFDEVIFLSEGQTAFFGHLENARLFFEMEGYFCPHGFDETEYYIKIISSHSKCQSSIESQENICKRYAKSDFFKYSFAIVPENLKKLEIEQDEQSARWCTQLNWLLWRIYLENCRTIINGFIAYQYYAFSIILIGIFYIQVDFEKQSSIKDVMGIIYSTSSELIFTAAYCVLYDLPKDIPIYLRERGFYDPSAFYLATIIAWIPKVMLKSLLVTIVLCFVLDSRPDNFFAYFLTTTISGICATAYGSAISAWIKNPDIVSITTVPIDLVSLIMSGIFFTIKSLPWYTISFKYLSIFHYAHETLAIIHWSSVNNIKCNVEELPCFESGSEVLADYGYSEDDLWPNAVGLMVLTVLMNFVGYLGMRRRRNTNSIY